MMKKPSQFTGPWQPHRMVADAIGDAFATAATNMTGSHVELGIAQNFDPEGELDGRPLPLNALVVRFDRPLRDVVVLLSTLKEDVLRPLAEAAGAQVLTMFDVPSGTDSCGPVGTMTLDQLVSFDDAEVALEQVDGLYLEVAYSLELPLGEVVLVVGTGLLEFVDCFVQGVEDPWSEGPPVDLHAAAASAVQDRLEMDDIDFAALMAGARAASIPSSSRMRSSCRQPRRGSTRSTRRSPGSRGPMRTARRRARPRARPALLRARQHRPRPKPQRCRPARRAGPRC